MDSLAKEEQELNDQVKDLLETYAAVVRSVWDKCKPYNLCFDYEYDDPDFRDSVHSYPEEIKWAFYLKKVTRITITYDGFALWLKNGDSIVIKRDFLSGSVRDLASRVRRIALGQKYILLTKMHEEYRNAYIDELNDQTKNLLSQREINNHSDENFFKDFLSLERNVQSKSTNYYKYKKISKTLKKTEDLIEKKSTKKIEARRRQRQKSGQNESAEN